MKKIKKIILTLVVILVVLLIAVVIAGAMFLGQIVKAGIEKVAPPMTQTSVTVDSVGLSILSGGAGLNNFVIGNPDPANYQSTNAISVGKIAVSLEPRSLFGDKIVIHSIEVRSPDITFEGNPFSKNNLQTILDNVNAAAGGTVVKSTNTPAAQPAQKAGAGKKIEVDDFVLAGAKVTARITGIGSTPIVVTLPIPDIHFTNLGTGPDGITVADLTQKILGEVISSSLRAVVTQAKTLATGAAGEVMKGATGSAGKAVNEGTDTLKKGLGNFLGK
jgi:hypothetical protein